MPVLPRFDLRGLSADAARFARALPNLGAALGRPVEDPATERLVEAMYFLAGTVLDKVSDFQAGAYDALAERVCPWLRRPIPAATVVAFDPPTSGRRVVPASTTLASAPVDGVACTFRPLVPCVVGAYRVRSVVLDAPPGRAPSVRIAIVSTGGEPLNDAVATGLSLYIDGELENALRLVHALTSDASSVVAESPDWPEPVAVLPAAVTRAGLTQDEALAPDPDGVAPAFGVVADAFAFPHKFRFFHVRGLECCASRPSTRQVTLVFALREALAPSTWLAGDEVRAHCAVVVNLFEATSEPLPLAFERGAMPIRIAGLARRAGGVYAVREARALSTTGPGEAMTIPDVRRLSAARSDARCAASFETSFGGSREDPDMMVTFGATSPAGAIAADDRAAHVVTMRILATNRALAGRVRAGDLAGEARPGKAGHDVIRYRNVVAASRYFSPPVGDAFALRAARHAAIRRRGPDPLGMLKDMLFLSIPPVGETDAALRALHMRVDALQTLDVSVARREMPSSAIRLGYAYRLAVEESAFRGPGDLALFGAVLHEALGRSVPVNTFVELTLVGTKGGFRATFPQARRA